MPSIAEFHRGDIVMHPKRPEWGEGRIEQVTTINHEGQTAQRLVIQFVNHGRVTINTAIAPLVAKGSISSMSPSPDFSAPKSAPFGASPASSASSSSSSNSADHWLTPSQTKGSPEELWKLPEAMTDPFATWNKRLAATVESYRYGTDARNGRSLLEWAMSQTLLNDPLSKYTRHELEQAFPRFLRDRDNHLFQMVRTLKKSGKSDVIQQVLTATTNPAGKTALQKAMRD